MSAADPTISEVFVAHGGDVDVNDPTIQQMLDATESGGGSSEAEVEAVVDEKIAELVDSSPAALNTLNELAAALGDDANFATTVTTALAAKLEADS